VKPTNFKNFTNYLGILTMKQRVKTKPDDKAQSERFIETARKVGADRESTAKGDDVMGRLVKQAPEPRKPHK
jgi:hypothetical protein